MRFLTFGLCLLFFSSCSDRPARAKFPGPPGRTTDLARSENTQAVLGGVDPNAQATVEEGKSIRGIARLYNHYLVGFVSFAQSSRNLPFAIS